MPILSPAERLGTVLAGDPHLAMIYEGAPLLALDGAPVPPSSATCGDFDAGPDAGACVLDGGGRCAQLTPVGEPAACSGSSICNGDDCHRGVIVRLEGASGAVRWASVLGDATNRLVEDAAERRTVVAAAVAVDDDGAVYVAGTHRCTFRFAGSSNGSNTRQQPLVLGLSSAGEPRWLADEFTHNYQNNNAARDVVAAGDIAYVVGTRGAPTEDISFLSRVDGCGTVPPGDPAELPNTSTPAQFGAVARGPSGPIAGGYFTDTITPEGLPTLGPAQGERDMFVVRADAILTLTDALHWVGSGDERITAIAVPRPGCAPSHENHLLVSGSFSGDLDLDFDGAPDLTQVGGGDAFLALYDWPPAVGAVPRLLWSAQIGAAGDDRIYAVEITPRAELVHVGATSSGSLDLLTGPASETGALIGFVERAPLPDSGPAPDAGIDAGP